MSVSSIIPYATTKTPIEFIKSEVERGLSNGSISIEQTIPRPIPFSPPIIFDLIYLNLSTIARMFDRNSPTRDVSLSNRRFGMSNGRNSRMLSIDFDIALFSYGQIQSNSRSRLLPMSSDRGARISEDCNFFELDDVPSPLRTSRVSSRKKLNGEEIAETLLSEASFTIATDKKPIVATYGCDFCVALGGYDATNKIAFIVNFSDAGEVRKSGGLILYNILKLVKEKITTPIQLHLKGGIKEISEPIIEAIKMWMKTREDLPMEIASEDILDSAMSFGEKSLSIDSRTGEVSDYDPMNNPKSRGMSYLDEMSARISAYEPQIKLAYSPKEF